jgi:hypothetical protein
LQDQPVEQYRRPARAPAFELAVRFQKCPQRVLHVRLGKLTEKRAHLIGIHAQCSGRFPFTSSLSYQFLRLPQPAILPGQGPQNPQRGFACFEIPGDNGESLASILSSNGSG